MSSKIAVLLVNLGTPDSPSPKDVYNYLIEFLTDPRVIDFPWLQRQLLVRGLIVPRRYKQSAAAYKKIWTSEGSPLLIYGNKVKQLLQKELGERFIVALAMRYQNPSIGSVLDHLLKSPLDQLIILPLFPQYASATTGSVHQKVMESLSRYPVIPKLSFINSYPTEKEMIRAFCERAREHDLSRYDHILFSFHGLPVRQLMECDRNNHCVKSEGCCNFFSLKNKDCYSAQCFATAQAIAAELCLKSSQYSICFQSRLGKEPWIQPYTSDQIEQLAKTGKKNLLVFCPSFVCDCLETTFEIGEEYQHLFKNRGGNMLTLVEGLNDHPLWIKALKEIILDSAVNSGH